jgi:hypothetical protein
MQVIGKVTATMSSFRDIQYLRVHRGGHWLVAPQASRGDKSLEKALRPLKMKFVFHMLSRTYRRLTFWGPAELSFERNDTTIFTQRPEGRF